ncbi:MAG TPA: phytoene/squalene synthase family protein [Stellaceae bacterium]
MPTPRSGRSGLSAAAELVRRHDRDRFQTALFAPAREREGLFALYAFNYEVARVREIVREPILGHIRLQWWREVVAAAFEGETPRRHEIVLSLTRAIREFGLSRPPFDRLIESREDDLKSEPPETMTGLEAYAEGSSASLVLLALEVLGEPSAAVQQAGRAVGIGYALAGLIRAMPFHAAGGRSYIPADLAARHGLDPADYRSRRTTARLRAAIAVIAAAAGMQFAEARKCRGATARQMLPALLPAVVADRFLRRLERVGYDPFDARLSRPDTMQSWRLAIAAWRGHY